MVRFDEITGVVVLKHSACTLVSLQNVTSNSLALGEIIPIPWLVIFRLTNAYEPASRAQILDIRNMK